MACCLESPVGRAIFRGNVTLFLLVRRSILSLDPIECLYAEAVNGFLDMPVTILQERPDSALSVRLVDELEAILAPHYPDASRHGYSVEKLLQKDVAFFVVRHDDTPAGCGGVQFFGDAYAELKRMYVRPQFRGLGPGKLLVNHLEQYSHEHGITVSRLETGIYQEAAIGLYERMGYERIAPFGDYTDDPLSVYYEKRLS